MSNKDALNRMWDDLQTLAYRTTDAAERERIHERMALILAAMKEDA